MSPSWEECPQYCGNKSLAITGSLCCGEQNQVTHYQGVLEGDGKLFNVRVHTVDRVVNSQVYYTDCYIVHLNVVVGVQQACQHKHNNCEIQISLNKPEHQTSHQTTWVHF